MSFRVAPARAPAVAAQAMVATSQPLATIAGLDVLREGGNAVDAALCAAAVLCVTEPEATGLGGDLFAIVRGADGQLLGLDAAGPSPRAAAQAPPALEGSSSVNVPGAVAGWGELSRRFGHAGLARCLAPAIAHASAGVVAGFNTAAGWGASSRAPWPAPAFGERHRIPGLAKTIDAVAANGPQYIYTGAPARAIADATWLSLEDLSEYTPRWVEPLTHSYRGVDVVQLPPPSQGVAALEALAILGDDEPDLKSEVSAVSLALDDALTHVRDGADVTHLLSPAHVSAKRGQLPGAVAGPAGGTVYVCAVDADGLAVSIMQSLFEGFGSGVLAGDTGIVLNNRAACFAVEGKVVPGRRPYHTLMPGMLTRGGELVGPFGVMGGFIQAQAQTQFVVELLRNGLDPQAALDRGRFRVFGDVLSLEQPLWGRADELAGLGLKIDCTSERIMFGGGQAIIVRDGTLFGGSDARKDGCALGI